MEKWLLHCDIHKLLLSYDQSNIEEAIDFIEGIIDETDDLSDDVRPCKDIISVPRSQYEESFPEYAEVFDTNATEHEIVTNFKFDEIPFLLKKEVHLLLPVFENLMSLVGSDSENNMWWKVLKKTLLKFNMNMKGLVILQFQPK